MHELCTRVIIKGLLVLLFVSQLSAQKSLFITNEGQWASDIQFATKGSQINVALANNKIFYYQSTENASIDVFQTEFLNSLQPMIMPEDEAITKFNFFKGNNQNNWQTNVSSFHKIRMVNIYPGINMLIMHDNGMPRYDFIVQPGSNPDRIRMRITGANSLQVNEKGLVINNLETGLIHTNLKAYQIIDGQETIVPCSFVNENGIISFKLGKYDKSHELVIDPTVFSDYLGGNQDDVINGVKIFNSDYIVVSGYTNSTNYPTTPGSYSTTAIGEFDIIVSKFKVTGATRELLFSTYIGGGNTDVSNGLDLDSDGDIYICGYTTSQDYPRINPSGYQYAGDQDAVMSKLSANGDKIHNSSIFGGSKVDVATGISVNPVDETATFIGYTNSSNYPVYGSSAQSKLGGLYDGFVTKINSSGTSMIFSTFWGGSNDDRGLAIDCDIDGSLFLGGETQGGNFPIYPYRSQWGTVLEKPYDYTYNGGVDGWVVQMSSSGAVEFSTFFGGKEDDRVTAVNFFSDGTILFAGESKKEPTAQSFPTTENTYMKTYKGGIDGFVAKLDKIKTNTSGWPPTTTKSQDLLFCSLFGGTQDDYVKGLAYNQNQEGFFVTGYTNSTNFPTIGDDIQTKSAAKIDAYVFEMSSQATDLLWSTYFGGTQDDHATAIDMDSIKNAVIVGYTSSSDLIKSNDNFQGTYQGGAKDGFIAKFTKGTLAVTYPIANDKFCAGQPVDVKYSTTVYANEEQFKVDFKLNPRESWQTLTTKAINGLFRWSMPTNTPISDSARFRVVHPSGLWKYSDYFQILALPTVKISTVTPESKVTCEGSDITITTDVTGSNLSYKWYFENNLISEQGTKDLQLTKVTPANSGKYKLVLVGTCKPDAVSNEVAITVDPATSISTEPADVNAVKGQSVTFSVVSNGLNLTYEWRRNGETILGATSSSYQLDNVQLSSEGNYDCIVKGKCGADTSRAALLKVSTNDVTENRTIPSVIELVSETNEKNIYRIKIADDEYISVQIFSVEGQLVSTVTAYNYDSSGRFIELDKKQLTSGIFFITVAFKDGSSTIPFTVIH